MIQIIINDILYPETSIEQYGAHPEDTGVDVEMIDGTTVTELSYRKMFIDYECEFVNNDVYLHAVQNIYRGNRLSVQYLVPESDDLQSGVFVLDGQFHGHWGDADWKVIRFRLRGVNPIA